MVTTDWQRFKEYKENGLVKDVFADEAVMKKMKGEQGEGRGALTNDEGWPRACFCAISGTAVSVAEPASLCASPPSPQDPAALVMCATPRLAHRLPRRHSPSSSTPRSESTSSTTAT